MGDNFTFDQIKNHLYKAAIRFYHKFPNKYEVDEIVNIVWVMGNVQKLDNIKYVSGRAYFDVIDHVRKQEGSKAMRYGVINDQVREINNMHHRDPAYEKTDFFSDVVNKYDCVECVDNKDQAEYILSCLPEQDAQVLRKYYLEDLNLKEVGEKLGLSESRVSAIRKDAIQLSIVAARLFRYDSNIIEAQKKNNAIDARCIRNSMPREEELEEILPEYVADFEIDNECAIDEEFVLERDWE